MKETDSLELARQLKNKNRYALGRAISIVENDREGKEILLNHAYRTECKDSVVMGITGAGGAGKSTLIDKLIHFYRRQGKTVGVLAVDPSSPFTGGAFLGDRVRMNGHNADTGVFIRSFGNREEHGGISRGAKQALYLYKSFGFDRIIVESVGVGQAETDIRNYVEVTALILAPGNGDGVQMLKAGTQEIADIFVINKADRPEADALYRQLENTLGMNRPPILKTIASQNAGIAELAEEILKSRNKADYNRNETRKRFRIRNEMLTEARYMIEKQLEKQAEELILQVEEGKITPFEAGIILGNRVINPNSNEEFSKER